MFCGECGCICMTSICVADNQLWLLWLNDGYHYEFWLAIMDYMAHIYMIIICITAHQRVIADYYHQSVWMSGNISVCLVIRVCTWVCTTYKVLHTNFLLLRLFLFVFFNEYIYLFKCNFTLFICLFVCLFNVQQLH